MKNFFEIRVSVNNGHNNMVFNRFEGKFVNNSDDNTAYDTVEQAAADLATARAAWNEYDTIEVSEIEVGA